MRNLLIRVPKSAQPRLATMVRAIFDRLDAAEVAAQYANVGVAIATKYPAAATHLEGAGDDLLAYRVPEGAAATGVTLLAMPEGRSAGEP
nr:transposase [Catellatospora sichuanensis]